MRRILLILLGLAALASTPAALAHEVRPAYLEIRQTEPETYAVLWRVPAVAGRPVLGLAVQFPEGSTDATIRTRSSDREAATDRWTVHVPGGLDGREVTVDGLLASATDALVRIERLDGTTQVGRLTPTEPEITVEAAPTFLSLAWTYFELGVEHIWFGIDHLLFVLALLLLVKGWWRVIGTITAFTIAHSITLGLAVFGVVHVPGPPVEAVIALSIVFVAVEIVHTHQGRESLAARQPWLVAFAFGLLHGLGFAGALAEVGLPQKGIPTALFFFNVGVEAGQIAFVLAVVAIAALVGRLRRTDRVRAPEWAELITPYAIGSVAMFWVIERTLGFLL